MFITIKNITIGLFKWFGFSIKRPGENCDDVLYINLGFVCIDIDL
jgi:hypothetical protein